MDEWLFFGSCVFALVLFVLSLLGVIVSLVFDSKVSERVSRIFVLLLPLEMCIIVFVGMPLLLYAVCLLLVW